MAAKKTTKKATSPRAKALKNSAAHPPAEPTPVELSEAGAQQAAVESSAMTVGAYIDRMEKQAMTGSNVTLDPEVTIQLCANFRQQANLLNLANSRLKILSEELMRLKKQDEPQVAEPLPDDHPPMRH